MLQDPSLHASFLNHGGLERLLEELRLNVKRDDLVCSVRTKKRVMERNRSLCSLDGLSFHHPILREDHSLADTAQPRLTEEIRLGQ